MAVYCTQCGTALPAGARYCSNCGTAISMAHGVPARHLIRPRAGRVIAGVCLALARTYGWDVAAVRIITVLALVFSSGLVGIAYLAAWVGIPEEPLDVSAVYPPGV